MENGFCISTQMEAGGREGPLQMISVARQGHILFTLGKTKRIVTGANVYGPNFLAMPLINQGPPSLVPIFAIWIAGHILG